MSPPGLTVREIVTEWVKLPDVPVILTVNVPVVAVLLALKVAVLVVVEGFGLNEADTPVGRVDVENVTLLLKPFVGLTVIVELRELPCGTSKLVREEERLKFGCPAVFTVRLTVVVWDRLPDTPVTVMV